MRVEPVDVGTRDVHVQNRHRTRGLCILCSLAGMQNILSENRYERVSDSFKTFSYSSWVMIPCLTERSSMSLSAGSILSTNTYFPSFSMSLPDSTARTDRGLMCSTVRDSANKRTQNFSAAQAASVLYMSATIRSIKVFASTDEDA